ncbi:hypothetical protein ACTJJ0_03465 [Chitinophaga sp. 22321]|uniref:Outer membrane protein beta-barrel domain-containing protein n=1 Tax=Chitinophaga hostae TaxID=2831022 RepID=A0ABS5IXN1_9BACT|nr:hypothetical protein [Chitinophaga hostae]MBS0027701.1 hypothetical protein [Chitinophaga hostae]
MIKHILFLLVIVFPLIVLGQTSVNLNLKSRDGNYQKKKSELEAKLSELKEKLKKNQESLGESGELLAIAPSGVSELTVVAKLRAKIFELQREQKSLEEEKSKVETEYNNLEPQSGKFSIKELARFGIYGIGNTSTSTLSNLNASGKFSGYFRPFRSERQFAEILMAFNINATNTDSLLNSTFLFPDVGVNSSYLRGSYNFKFNGSSDMEFFLLSPFAEFSFKNIRGRLADSTKNFYTLNYTLGGSVQWLLRDDDINITISLTPYYSRVVVPSSSEKDYKYLIKQERNDNVATKVNCLGVKFAAQINYFQIFTDLRWAVKEKKELPNDMAGFHPNIGITFNAQIFER